MLNVAINTFEWAETKKVFGHAWDNLRLGSSSPSSPQRKHSQQAWLDFVGLCVTCAVCVKVIIINNTSSHIAHYKPSTHPLNPFSILYFSIVHYCSLSCSIVRYHFLGSLLSSPGTSFLIWTCWLVGLFLMGEGGYGTGGGSRCGHYQKWRDHKDDLEVWTENSRPYHQSMEVINHPIKTPYQYTLWNHPVNTPYQYTLWNHPVNTPYQTTITPCYINLL